MGIEMPDGTRLSARVWMPEDALNTPVPVILEHLPYRKRDGTIVRDEYSHPWMAGHGYCCIRTDMRGSGDSEGLMEDEYTAQELQDACDVIAWAAAQPWCNGNVGMQGISWGGFNSLQVAALKPPALKAIITICSTVDRYADDIHYKGGCLLVENFGWASNMLSYNSRPPDPELVGDEKWRDMWHQRLEAQEFLWRKWHSHQYRDAYWEHGSVCEDYAAIEASVLSIGGWHDGYRNTISHLVENISAPVKGIVGPWNHKYPHYAGPKPAIGFLQEAKRWWDKWLKGDETGVEHDPAYRAYLMDSVAPKRWFHARPGRWIAEEAWPSPDIQTRTLHFGETSLGDAPTEIAKKIRSPQHCGAMSGEYFPFAFGDELPDEQSPDDQLSLCFDGVEEPEIIDIVGAPKVRIEFSSDQPISHIAVRLCDLRPDGTSALITYGVLSLTHYKSHAHPEALSKGERYSTEFNLDQIAYRLPAGHRMRLAISNAYWPLIWPSPQIGTLTVHGGSVEIPERGTRAQADECTFEEPVGAPAWRAKEMRAANYSRSIETNAKTGIVTTSIQADNGENLDLEHGLASGSWFKEAFHIHPDDPRSARATSEWEQTGGREGAMWSTHVVSEMTCDESYFYATASLRVELNGALFFKKRFSDKVKRDLV